MSKRRRLKHQLSLQDRLSAWANEVREQANQLRPGPEDATQAPPLTIWRWRSACRRLSMHIDDLGGACGAHEATTESL